MKIHILPLLGTLFVMAIVSRAYALSSETLALTNDKNKPEISQSEHSQGQTQPATATVAPQPATQAEARCVTGDVLIAVTTKLSLLDKRAAEIAKKESAFTAIRTRLDKQLVAINSAKASLDASVDTRTALAQQDIEHLTLMYQTMKPKQAAKIFDEMDINFAAGFLRKMKGAHAGLILSNMNAKKAYKISIIIASRGAKYRPAEGSAP